MVKGGQNRVLVEAGMNRCRRPDDVWPLHAQVDSATRRLEVVHEARLQCGRGCCSCCVDGLTVFEVEAEHIRRHHRELLASTAPHPPGACAFLSDDGACRIYGVRPYVCRTQGLPLRWLEESDDGATLERRDICPLNEAEEPIEALAAEDCFTLGPFEERLARLQLAADAHAPRVRLRDLFAASAGRAEPTPIR